MLDAFNDNLHLKIALHSIHFFYDVILEPRLQGTNGNLQVPFSTATVSMVHSVPELMVSSEVSHVSEGNIVVRRHDPCDVFNAN